MRAKELHKFFMRVSRWLIGFAYAALDKSLSDCFRDVVPAMLAVLSKIVTISSVPNLVRVVDYGVVENDEQVRLWVDRSAYAT